MVTTTRFKNFVWLLPRTREAGRLLSASMKIPLDAARACVVGGLMRIADALPSPLEEGDPFLEGASLEWLDDASGIAGFGKVLEGSKFVRSPRRGLLLVRADEWIARSVNDLAAARMRKIRARKKASNGCATVAQPLRNAAQPRTPFDGTPTARPRADEDADRREYAGFPHGFAHGEGGTGPPLVLRNGCATVAQRSATAVPSPLTLPLLTTAKQQAAKQKSCPAQKTAQQNARAHDTDFALRPAAKGIEVIKGMVLLQLLPDWDKRREGLAREALEVLFVDGKRPLAHVTRLRGQASAQGKGAGWITNALRREAGLETRKSKAV